MRLCLTLMANYWLRFLLLLSKSNRQVLVATEKERRQGEYNKISPKDKATITKYASKHGVAHAALGDDVQVKVLLEKKHGKDHLFR